MVTPRPRRRLSSRGFLPLAVAAALWPFGLTAQSSRGLATMTVTATVVRSCVVETEASPGAGGTANASAQLRVTLTCSQNTLPSRRQTLTGTPGPSADTVPRHARTITLAADGRAVILF